jgi:hypothetical protein
MFTIEEHRTDCSRAVRTETATGEQAETTPSKVWPVVIALAIPGWLVVVFGVDVIPVPCGESGSSPCGLHSLSHCF